MSFCKHSKKTSCLLLQDLSEALEAGSAAILTQTDQWGQPVGAISPPHGHCLV